ncbi:MAG: 4'-phosphopantetheinyl transferase superfamily protein [Thermoanaerobaculales bacterium]|jgi:4'-phosphopantetheinyl transferase|nr:4'-phosphopantetheinyl transferase superfamily protein [Thermoanaerobaculales bacterium]
MDRPPLQLVWARCSDFGDRFGELETRLPDDERQRAARFKVAEARRRFVLGRALLRHRIGAAIDADPRSLVFSMGEHGKPELPGVKPAPSFNLSHSADLVVLALAPAAVGVDIEALRAVPAADRLAHRFFSRSEAAAVRAADAADRDRVFFRIWTQKEAWLKATGLGVGMPLREVETEPDPSRPPRVIAVSKDRDEAARWSLTEITIPDAVCIVAVARESPAIDVHRIHPDDLDLH